MPTFEWQSLATSIGSGLLTGGFSAITALYAFFRTLKTRVKNLEDRLGSTTEPKTGLSYQLSLLEDDLDDLQKEVRSWEAAPPEWLVRTVRRMSAVDVDGLSHVREQMNQCCREMDSLRSRLDRCVDRDVCHEEMTRRTEEVSKLRETLGEIKGQLNGVLVALGQRNAEEV